ncbi:MAG: hypothetical protein ACTSSI_06375, partial [Candidatus Helarchaeota archaeon]
VRSFSAANNFPPILIAIILIELPPVFFKSSNLEKIYLDFEKMQKNPRNETRNHYFLHLSFK